MSLGEYLGAGSAITKGLYHLENVNDSSGNGNTLTNTGSVGFVAGKFRNCADFGTANTTKRLSVATAFGLSVNAARTMSIWMKQRTELSGADSTPRVISLSHTSNNVAYEINYERVSSVNQISALRARSGVGADRASFAISLGTANWYNVLLTFDGTTLLLYFNGFKVANINPNTGNGSSGLSDGFAIGATPAGANFSSIYADECIVENVAWSAQKIAKYYTFSRGRFR